MGLRLPTASPEGTPTSGVGRPSAPDGSVRNGVQRQGMLHADRRLLEGYRRGDRDVLEQVYRQHVVELQAFFRRGFGFESEGRSFRFRGTRSSFQVEDWAHEVFVRAFSEASRLRYDGLRPFRPYLERIARNVVLDELKRKEHALRRHVDVLPEPDEALDPDLARPGTPEEITAEAELREHVAAFVDALPPRERAVYRERFTLGREQRDVASATGLSLSKVKTSEKRIRAGFRAHLAENGWLRSERTPR